jgi:archaemetzincin
VKDRPIQALQFLTIGSFPRAVAEDLVARVSRRVSVPCRLLDSYSEAPLPLLPERHQVDADSLLKSLEKRNVEPETILVGVIMRDLGIPIFTFVFGLASRNRHTALVSLARLRPEFYGLPPNQEIMARRAVAEILHEVGHAVGVESIDLRGDTFCPACQAELPRGLLPSGSAAFDS